jgi:hypothetical protein
MATGLIKANSIFGLEVESTEGTYVAPSAATSYVQLLEGFEFKPSREVIDRGLITASPGRETPRLGMKSVTAQMPVEMRASGTEGAEPDFDYLLKGALGSRRQNTTAVTARAGVNTSTVILIEDADISKFAVGDMVLVKASGAHELRPISARATGAGVATITFPFALTAGAPASGVGLSKFSTYYTADTGHISISASYYWANEIRQAAFGCKVSSMSVDNFKTGKVPGLGFTLDGVGFTDINGVAPHTPTYDSGLPPMILNACVWRAGVLTPINDLTLGLKNELGFLTSTCSANGKTGSRVKSREIKGSINPYMDDTTTTYFDDWIAGTEFSLFAYAYNPSSTTGEITMGSVVGIWLPQCFTEELSTADLDGILVNGIGFRATRGAAGTSEEMYLGLV